MLKKRVITVLCVLPLLIAAVWFGKPWFTILMAIWGLAAVLEFYTITKVSEVRALAVFGLLWTLLFIISPYFNYPFILPLILASAVVVSLIMLLTLPRKEGAFISWAWAIAGILYIGWLLSYFVALRELTADRDWSNWALLALLTVFATDTTAFFIGRKWGKRPLAPHVSPKKTWEGAIAGVLGGVIASLILLSLLRLPINIGPAVLAGFLISVLGQLGDLVESLFKRNMGAKDSSHLLPGHGGILDRMDSVVFAGVVVYYFATIVGR